MTLRQTHTMANPGERSVILLNNIDLDEKIFESQKREDFHRHFPKDKLPEFFVKAIEKRNIRTINGLIDREDPDLIKYVEELYLERISIKNKIEEITSISGDRTEEFMTSIKSLLNEIDFPFQICLFDKTHGDEYIIGKTEYGSEYISEFVFRITKYALSNGIPEEKIRENVLYRLV
jgi:hypothetical protein